MDFNGNFPSSHVKTLIVDNTALIGGDEQVNGNLTVNGTITGGSVVFTGATASTFTATTRFSAPDGTVALPGYAFTGDTSQGIGRSGTETYIAQGSAKRLRITPTLIDAGTSSLSAGPGTFASLTTTGSATVGSVVSSGPISGTSGTFTAPILETVGSATAPAYSFTSSTSSGIYYNTSSSLLSLSSGGTDQIRTGGGITSFGVGGTGSTIAGQQTCTSLVDTGTASFAGITSSGSIKAPDGIVSTPGFSFSAAPNTGISRTSVGPTMIFSVGGFDSLDLAGASGTSQLHGGLSMGPATVSSLVSSGSLSATSGTFSAPLLEAKGSATAPAYSFTSFPSSGIYFDTNTASVTTAVSSTDVLKLASTSTTSLQSFLGPVASAAFPTFSFTGHISSGLFFDTSGTAVDTSVGGTTEFSVGSGGVTVTGDTNIGGACIAGGNGSIGGSLNVGSQILVNDNSASAPPFTRYADGTTGMYFGATPEIDLSIGGVQKFSLTSALGHFLGDLTVDGKLTAGSVSIVPDKLYYHAAGTQSIPASGVTTAIVFDTKDTVVGTSITQASSTTTFHATGSYQVFVFSSMIGTTGCTGFDIFTYINGTTQGYRSTAVSSGATSVSYNSLSEIMDRTAGDTMQILQSQNTLTTTAATQTYATFPPKIRIIRLS